MLSATRRVLASLLAFAQFSATVVCWMLVAPAPALALSCATPGKDGAGGTLSGTVNSYYAGTASAPAGATSIAVNGPLAMGSATAISSGDLLLVIQISGASINSTNTMNYGSGSGSASGSTALNSAGKFEYVKATSAVAAGSVSIAGTGSGGGLINSYTSSTSAASPAEFQIIRVRQYTTATLGSALTGAAWQFYNGGGGVIAIDVDSTLTLAGNVTMTAQGFAGGDLAPSANGAANAAPYTVYSSSLNVTNQAGQGIKGEGAAGAPQYTRQYTTAGAPSTAENYGSDLLPGGGAGAGAPANAGGGGSEASNDSGGGGGGANGGAGGYGGESTAAKGYGGTALAPGATFIALGGGGGSGNAETTVAATSGEGGSGGGIILIRAKSIAGSGTLSANGAAGQVDSTKNDAGGGGAGGTIMVTTTTGNLTGLTAVAAGGAGGGAPNFYPGGGGGGGAVLLSSAATSATVGGGAAGSSANGAAAAGGAGIANTGITPASIPGVSSGAECSASPASFAGNGPVGANAAVGSYDGVVAVNGNDDFTAVAFTPAGANFTNSSTTPGSPTGDALGGPTVINVPNELDYTASAAGNTLTLTGTAPAGPAGWTMRICPDSAGAPSCATTALWTTVGAASAAPASVLTLTAAQHLASYKYWAVYSAPAGVVAYTRYDALVHAGDGTLSNETHNELYPGFIPLTKTVTVASTGCPAGVSPPATGVCPGGMLLYTVDYRNIVAGGNAVGNTVPLSAFPMTAAGTLVITENGSTAGNTWAAVTQGLHELLVAGANGTTAFGDSTSGSTFTGNAVGSTGFSCTVGGASFQLVPQGLTGTNKGWQGTITYRLVVR